MREKKKEGVREEKKEDQRDEKGEKRSWIGQEIVRAKREDEKETTREKISTVRTCLHGFFLLSFAPRPFLLSILHVRTRCRPSR